PLLYPGFFGLIEALSERGIGLDLETNGTLIGPLEAEKLARTTTTVSVSLDGAEPETHDSMRGVKGAFKRSVSALREMAGNGVTTQIIMTLTRANVQEIDPVIALAQDLGASSLKINPVVPCGRAENIFHQNQNLSPDELMSLERGLINNSSGNGLQVELDLPIGLKSLQSLTSGSQSQCMIRNILGVLSDGSLALCGIGQVEPDLVLGTLDDDLSRIWNEADVLIWLREVMVEQFEGVCGRCFFRFSCLGACRANAYAVEHRLTAPFYLCQEAYEQGSFPSSRYE
ncbi:MAG: radical SAM protein, partial [Deltaproteobacteria bacterium]|nr:radical SAM protein [Deltaproteobacteria bacterium]